uniref:Protein inhibitor of activated STAT, 4b n=1 Tax=Oncorhynchus mykiss TaxID=8022 RepID=A0A8K9X461_ONCMY
GGGGVLKARLLAHLRVTELRSLMAAMGQTKSGLKSNLLVRAVRVIQTQCNPHLLTVVRQLYQERYSNQIVPGSIQHINSLTHDPTQHTNNLTHNPRLFQMVPLPFYQALGTVLPPRQLGRLTLSFCFTESLGYEEDQYPPFSSPIILHCPSDALGQEIHRHCTPINITPTVSLSLLPSFRLCVWWKRCSKRYSVAVYLVKVLSPSDLLSQLKSQSVESLTFCRQRIQEKLRFNPECEVTTTGLQVSLICPLGKMRLSVPCRGRKCGHLQCFDGTLYLQMNEKRPTWTCPVCHKLVPYIVNFGPFLLTELVKLSQVCRPPCSHTVFQFWPHIFCRIEVRAL